MKRTRTNGHALPENRTAEGRFAQGKSGNPGGRPKGVGKLREELEKYSTDMTKRLVEATNDSDMRTRLEALKIAFAYLYGRPGLLDGGNVPLSPERGQISSALLAEAQAILTGEVAPSDEGEGERADGSP